MANDKNYNLIDKKLNLIIRRQNFLAAIILKMNFDYDEQKKIEKKWDDLNKTIIGEYNGAD